MPATTGALDKQMKHEKTRTFKDRSFHQSEKKNYVDERGLVLS